MASLRCIATSSSSWFHFHPASSSHFRKSYHSGLIPFAHTPSSSYSQPLCANLAQLQYGKHETAVDKESHRQRSAELVDIEYAELNLRDNVREFGGARVRQHVNPLKASLVAPVEPPNWEDIFEDTRLPLMVDIGSGSGRFLILLAKRSSGTKNFLGLEVRNKLVQRSQFWTKELAIKNIYFMVANATVSFGTIVSTYPGPLTCVSILCPDPHFKRKHRKRRILREPLVDSIINNLDSGGQIFMQSDVQEVAVDMRQQFDSHFGSLQPIEIHHRNLCDGDGWLLENPMGLRTEREIHAQSEGAIIYRRLYKKC